jgi:hypothetical protein
MASGDDIEAGRTTGASDRTILIGHKSRPSSDFVGDFIFEAAPQRVGGTPQAPDRDLVGIRGIGNRGGIGVVGLGGFMDRAGRDFGSTGVLGAAGGVAVERRGGSGVVGNGGPGNRQRGGIGVLGFGGAGDRGFADGPGVMGQSNTAQGVVGVSAAPSSSGVFGLNSSTAGFATGVFGSCDAPGGAGVAGRNLNGDGVNGFSDGNIGVVGGSGAHMGVLGFAPHIGIQGQGGNAAILGFSPTGHGVIGIAPTRGKFAGSFTGNVQITGTLTVFSSAKSAAVRTGKNEYRRLYTMESPESWFEDFGEGALRRGRATVRISTDFAPLVRTGNYHVFITPYGDCGGLFVANRSRTQFEVRELNGGKSNVRFSYRIIAKRKDIPGKRLEKLTLPDLPGPERRARNPVPTKENDARRMLRNLDLPAMRRDAARRARG